MRRLALIFLIVATPAYAQTTYRDWEQQLSEAAAELQALTETALEDPPEGFRLTEEAIVKLGSAQLAADELQSVADQTVPEVYEIAPPPAVQVFSTKPNRDSWNTPLMINLVDHDDSGGKYGEIYVVVNKAEPHEIPGIDTDQYPGLEETGYWIRDDYLAVLTYRWSMDELQLTGPIPFEIARGTTQSGSGLEAGAICRLTDGDPITELTHTVSHGGDYVINQFTPLGDHTQLILAVAANATYDLASIPAGWEITADLGVFYDHPWNGPYPVAGLIICERETDPVQAEGPFVLELEGSTSTIGVAVSRN